MEIPLQLESGTAYVVIIYDSQWYTEARRCSRVIAGTVLRQSIQSHADSARTALRRHHMLRLCLSRQQRLRLSSLWHPRGVRLFVGDDMEEHVVELVRCYSTFLYDRPARCFLQPMGLGARRGEQGG